MIDATAFEAPATTRAGDADLLAGSVVADPALLADPGLTEIDDAVPAAHRAVLRAVRGLLADGRPVTRDAVLALAGADLAVTGEVMIRVDAVASGESWPHHSVIEAAARLRRSHAAVRLREAAATIAARPAEAPLVERDLAVLDAAREAVKGAVASMPCVTTGDKPVWPVGSAVSRRASSITPRSVEWLWTGRLARAAITMLVSPPGVGKTFVSCDMIARVTRGWAWPGQSEPRPAAGVVVLNVEDDAETALIPRLIASGADMDRIEIVDGRQGKSGVEPLYLDDGAAISSVTSRLRASIGDVALVVLDTAGALLPPGTDGDNNADVRAALRPVAALAMLERFAVLMVHHDRKAAGSATDKPMGSRGWVGAARIVLHLT